MATANSRTLAIKKDEYLNKPHQTIQIEGKLNFIQHKCWNILALNAVKNNLKVGTQRHQMSLTDLYKYLDYDGENDVYLTKLLEAISRINISGDVFREDGSKFWIVFNLFAQCVVENGICHYEYPSFVAEVLSSPKKYVKILLKLQNKFNSNYSLKLYEFLKTKYIEKLGKGTTGEITIQTFRDLMGIKGQYTLFNNFKNRVLTPAIKEINEKTDLFVELELIKNRQKVVALKFQITENPNKKQNLQGLDLESLDGLDFGNETETTTEPNNILKTKLEKLGFGENQIDKLLADPEPQKVLDCTDYVTFKLELEIEKGKTKNKIQSPTGYFFTIYNAYEDIDFSGLKDWRARKAKAEQENLEWERKQKEEEEEEQRQAKLSKLKQEKIAKYKQENPLEVEEICMEVLGRLQTENKTFILEQIKKEAKKKEVSLIKTVASHLLTKHEVDSKIWERVEK